MDGFIPVQPSKPLLIDDFLSLNAPNALKSAPGKLMIDSHGTGIYVQTDLSGVGTKKIKCPDLPAWLKASDKIKAALITMGAIQGPDYDRYFDSCMTLLLDPKCGGNGWSLEIFFEFDNAHRLQQWHTGSAFDVICPLRMAHFAAMSASSKLTPTFLGDSGGTKKRTRSAPFSRAGKPAKAPPNSCYVYNNTGHCAKFAECKFTATRKCIYCTTGPITMPPVPAPATPILSLAPVQTTQDIRRPGQWRQSYCPDKVAWIESLIALRLLDLSAWQHELREDSDREFLLYLVEHGLSLTNSNTILSPFRCRNYKSAYLAPADVNAALAPDILRQRIFHPYPGDSSQFVHALGAVPKTATTVRVIHNHSRPYGRSLNYALSQSNFSFDSVDDAVVLMRTKCYMAKVDIEAAYRHVPIDPSDWDKLAFRWPSDSDSDSYVDGYLQFGLMNACEVFNRISRAIVRMMACKGFKCLVVYVNDFLIICSDQATTWYAYSCSC
jgi:hypothetical protein